MEDIWKLIYHLRKNNEQKTICGGLENHAGVERNLWKWSTWMAFIYWSWFISYLLPSQSLPNGDHCWIRLWFYKSDIFLFHFCIYFIEDGHMICSECGFSFSYSYEILPKPLPSKSSLCFSLEGNLWDGRNVEGEEREEWVGTGIGVLNEKG